MGLPPSLAGAVHETVACASPAVAVTPVGAPGTVAAGTGGTGAAGVTLLDGAEAALVPTALVAVRVNVYPVPLVRPVTPTLVAGAATVIGVPTAGLDVTV